MPLLMMDAPVARGYDAGPRPIAEICAEVLSLQERAMPATMKHRSLCLQLRRVSTGSAEATLRPVRTPRACRRVAGPDAAGGGERSRPAGLPGDPGDALIDVTEFCARSSAG